MRQISKRLGFFTRLLDDASAAERYRLAIEQIVHAEAEGFDSAWVAQHHFNAEEGGLPAPFVFLSQVAARTSRIRIGTGVVTLPLENPVRVAEDSAVLDLLSGGRLEVGIGAGGTPTAFPAFGYTHADRGPVFAEHLHVLLDAWRGDALGGHGNRLYPAAPHLLDRVWQATFSVEGGRRAGLAGDGLMLSRTQPRDPAATEASLAEIQEPIIAAYLDALPAGRVPRILASRSVFVADDPGEARRLAELGFGRYARWLRQVGRTVPGRSLDEMIRSVDSHVGTPEQVIASLRADRALARATDFAVQVHPIDPPHAFILRSIELVAREVAPALGWVRTHPAASPALAAAG
jgi:putative FMN-dependent luciferase-like monooxygenase